MCNVVGCSVFCGFGQKWILLFWVVLVLFFVMTVGFVFYDKIFCLLLKVLLMNVLHFTKN